MMLKMNCFKVESLPVDDDRTFFGIPFVVAVVVVAAVIPIVAVAVPVFAAAAAAASVAAAAAAAAAVAVAVAVTSAAAAAATAAAAVVVVVAVASASAAAAAVVSVPGFLLVVFLGSERVLLRLIIQSKDVWPMQSVCVCVLSVCLCVQLCLKEPIRMMQGAEGLISRPLPMKLRGIETGKRTCSGRHGHMSAACGQHYSDMSACIATVMSEGLQQS